MSRTQISVPPKSKALMMPVPVITHTFLPSVAGEGDDMFCFIMRWLPLPRRCFQTMVPRLRSTAQRNRSLPSATFRKRRSPHTIGVEPDQAGNASFQVMFSVFDHRTGRFFSLLMPFRDG